MTDIEAIVVVAGIEGPDVRADIAVMMTQIGNLQSAVNGLLYVAPQILTLTASGSDPRIVEVGSSVSSVALAWTLSKTVTSQLISGASSATVPPGTTTYTATGPYTTDRTWTLTVDDGTAYPGHSDSDSVQLLFQSRRYWGALADETVDDADILDMPFSELATAFGPKAITYNCTGGRYPYYVFPADWGTPANVTVNGLAFSDFSNTTQSFINASGSEALYRVLRFNNLLFGAAVPVVWQ